MRGVGDCRRGGFGNRTVRELGFESRRLYDGHVSSSAAEHIGADEELVRAHAAELTALGAAHGIHALRFASPGRLVGRVASDRDALDMAEFAAEAERLLGADVSSLSDAVLNKPNVSRTL